MSVDEQQTDRARTHSGEAADTTNSSRPRGQGDSHDATAGQIVRFRARGWSGQLVSGTPLHAWLVGGGRPEQLLEAADVVLKQSARTHTVRVRMPGPSAGGEGALSVKAYMLPGMHGCLNRLVGRHRPPRVWRSALAMADAGATIPQPLGYLAPHPWWSAGRSYFFSTWIEGARHATELTWEEATRDLVIEHDDFGRQVAEALAALHRAGVFHGDMKWSNVLRDASGRVCLVDFDASHQRTWHTDAAAARDLARFLADAVKYGVSQRWRTMFLDEYAARRGVRAVRILRRVPAMVDRLRGRSQRRRTTS